MLEAWSEPTWDCFVVFGPFPGAKGFSQFCHGGLNPAGKVAGSQSDARGKEAEKKKPKRSNECQAESCAGVQATSGKENQPPNEVATGLTARTKMWKIQRALKYGSGAAKSNALALLDRDTATLLDQAVHAQGSTDVSADLSSLVEASSGHGTNDSQTHVGPFAEPEVLQA
mmetsp:Transcript_10923/g.30897  ORF Transcript_10923/g.30897 Transcript_10923/m.30897 type:complete len:171 (+) Transcript_10923:632-1144(+)